ncbi:glycoside hydrolase family 15 protein [Microbacterium invictum]|uniref:GH15 family glucan-1,4-alpha-glucosidase n=1 Tax=Microbacterium invictum TaxID=515415 RepID=A0AA40VNZ3_9MICO|nr:MULTISPECIES: glycoside hydrolase family 15 protein [Microbacterium]MBB4140913.1 GH15 family glucan-1,4-alpha-glucosidase [Microbacterium invictum]
MPAPIEDYALLSNRRTVALVSRQGSIDWLCLPRYDSPSVFGALLGDEEHGCWSLHPVDRDADVTRQYDGDSFVLVTRWESDGGVAEVHDFMPLDGERADVVRRIVGISGTVSFETRLWLRFDYARGMPWVRQVPEPEGPALLAVVGPGAVVVRGAELTADAHSHRGILTAEAGTTIDLTMTWFPSHLAVPARVDVDVVCEATRTWWQEWAGRIDHTGPHHDKVVRSLLVLNALSHADTGGIVAAATTSLPEEFGGERNWDYRYVWLRDAAMTLEALIGHGFLGEAERWRGWLLRAVAGDPADVQIMYGIAGERDLPERTLTSLPGYAGSRPVRIGNGAVSQFQGDVIGEVLLALEAARAAGLEETSFSWPLQRALVERVVATIDRPDNGMWEIRGEPQKFTHSRAMMWAALDCGVRAVIESGLDGDGETWARWRDRLRAEIDEQGVHPTGGHFVQYYGSEQLDASLLLLPEVGFCAHDDPRMLATVDAIERDLMRDGLLLRYRTDTGVDGLAGDEHPFLACSFWLVEQYAATGRDADAAALMERLCALTNDVGLLSEEYDVDHRRHVGNTPQAFSHLALVRAADALAGRPEGTSRRR